jgi:hypothetical protein
LNNIGWIETSGLWVDSQHLFPLRERERERVRESERERERRRERE